MLVTLALHTLITDIYRAVRLWTTGNVYNKPTYL